MCVAAAFADAASIASFRLPLLQQLFEAGCLYQNRMFLQRQNAILQPSRWCVWRRPAFRKSIGTGPLIPFQFSFTRVRLADAILAALVAVIGVIMHRFYIMHPDDEDDHYRLDASAYSRRHTRARIQPISCRYSCLRYVRCWYDDRSEKVNRKKPTMIVVALVFGKQDRRNSSNLNFVMDTPAPARTIG